jgi:hypothetical protein
MKRRMNIIEEIIFSCVYHNPLASNFDVYPKESRHKAVPS